VQHKCHQKWQFFEKIIQLSQKFLNFGLSAKVRKSRDAIISGAVHDNDEMKARFARFRAAARAAIS